MPEPTTNTVGNEQKYKLGLKNVHYYPVNVSEEGVFSLGEGKKWPGAVALSMEVEGDSNTFWADDGAYAINEAIPTEKLEFESAMVPEDFEVSYLGARRDEDGNIVDADEDKASYFALAFEFSGDKNAIRYLYFYCKASKPSDESETKKDSNEPKTIKTTMTASGIPGIGRRKRSCSTTKKEAYDSWYTSPKLPKARV